jgi:hypothetical protein
MKDHLFTNKTLIIEPRNIIANDIRIVQVRKTKTLRYYLRITDYVWWHVKRKYKHFSCGEGREWLKLKEPLIEHVIVLNYAYYFNNSPIWDWYYKLSSDMYLINYDILNYLTQINKLPTVIWSLILDYVSSYTVTKVIK